MTEFLIAVAAHFAWAAIGFAIIPISRLTLAIMPTRRLWRLSKPTDLIVCAATSAIVDTGEYPRPATGIGQLRALVLVAISLRRAYSAFNLRHVLLSNEPLQTRIENDLILLGGPETNAVTLRFMKELKDRKIVWQENHVQYWLAESADATLTPIVESRQVKVDFGLIVRMRNPFSRENRTVTIFSGTHTYGTSAAARYFTENLYHRIRFRPWDRFRGSFATIVRCEVVDGYPTHLSVVKHVSFEDD